MLICLYVYLDKHTPSTVTIIHYMPRDVKSNKLIIYQRLMYFIVWFIWGGGRSHRKLNSFLKIIPNYSVI